MLISSQSTARPPQYPPPPGREARVKSKSHPPHPAFGHLLPQREGAFASVRPSCYYCNTIAALKIHKASPDVKALVEWKQSRLEDFNSRVEVG